MRVACFVTMRFVALIIAMFIAAVPSLPAAGQTSFEPSTNRPGGDYRSFDLPSPNAALCQNQCNAEQMCQAWTYVSPGVQGPNARCWLKNTAPGPVASNCCVSGARAPTAGGGLQITFSGYGNPQRPFPGYVGPFQLGPVSIAGSVAIRESDGAVVGGGLINHTDNLKDPNYPSHATTWRVLRATSVQRAGAATTITLQVTVVSSNYPQICPVGTQGVVTLVDDKSRLANGQTNDSIGTLMPSPSSTASNGGAACGTHVHGMNNTNVAWTDPPVGGPPNGGMWAIVNAGGGGGRGGNQAILGSWRRTSDNSVVTFTQEGEFIVGRLSDPGSSLQRYGFSVGEVTFRLKPSGGNQYSGQVEWRDTNHRVWWQNTVATVVGDRMTGTGDVNSGTSQWVRLSAGSVNVPAGVPHQGGGRLVDPPR